MGMGQGRGEQLSPLSTGVSPQLQPRDFLGSAWKHSEWNHIIEWLELEDDIVTSHCCEQGWSNDRSLPAQTAPSVHYSNACSIRLNTIPFPFFPLIFLFSPSEELIKGLKVREILLAHLMGIVFLISAFLFVFLQKFCSSYFSLKQLKSLSKPSECLVPTVFLLHSGKCTASQTISIPVCFIP